jgi:hypothetical protein
MKIKKSPCWPLIARQKQDQERRQLDGLKFDRKISILMIISLLLALILI